ncbi:MAG: Re/Si-specific NAD(P)(+) transhydrogenase subunit alpha [Proteobacteria bacterium]|nr:Re/Si-specific NAD(P)(+) transhydrogenase subunit alpha [Pseudomonadota bacterium]
MIIAAVNEGPSETRVAITPDAVKQYISMGFSVQIEKDAGLLAGFTDKQYKDAGASISTSSKTLLPKANILLLVNEPNPTFLKELSKESLIIAPVNKDAESKLIQFCTQHQLSLFSMLLIPRISRAQSLDSLSSQANLAGYRAVIEAISHYKRAIPMMMTAAGMIHPAKVLVLGAGVAGLQAIATAKRMGAVVYAFDVRTAAKEQVESLGAEFIEVASDENNETAGGYASETSDEYKKKQAELIEKYASEVNIIISTAQIPGRKAPILLPKKAIANMKEGSVVVDLATASGGNCELSEKDKIIVKDGVTIIGLANMAGLVPATASELYATNLRHLIQHLAPKAELTFNEEDEIVQAALLCHQGDYLPFQAKEI